MTTKSHGDSNKPARQKKAASGRDVGQKWCTVYNKTNPHGDAKSYVQGDPRSQTGRARTATWTSAQTRPDDNENIRPGC